MNSIEYSSDAENVLKDFYAADAIVYVEGDDDVVFWGGLFEELINLDLHIEPVGGKEALQRKIDVIVNNGAEVYVACDRDYSDFTSPDNLACSRILITYGYSIENTMYCPVTIASVASKLAKRLNRVKPDDVKTWLTNNMLTVRRLVLVDIANMKYMKGQCILGDTSMRFLKSKNSIELCHTKISNRLIEKLDYYIEDEIEDIDKLMSSSSKFIHQLIRGHFLTNMVSNYIKDAVKRYFDGKSTSISNESLFEMTVDGCVKCKTKCTEKDYFSKTISEAFS